MATERLQKILARAGVASRRKAEGLILDGGVQVNGITVTTLGTQADAEHDRITVRGKPITLPTRFRYVLLHKPVGVVCTRRRFRGERSVYELVPQSQSLVIAGRLDKDSTGLVLLTDDGDLVQQLTHPSFRHQKEYLVRTTEPLVDADLDRLRRGISLTEGLARVDRVTRENSNTVRVVLHQGWKHQIRRMCEAIKHHVVSLQRIRLAAATLGSLPEGEYRTTTRERIIGPGRI